MGGGRNKTKLMQSHLETKVGVEVEAELGNFSVSLLDDSTLFQANFMNNTGSVKKNCNINFGWVGELKIRVLFVQKYSGK